jgi:hypothetical protein
MNVEIWTEAEQFLFGHICFDFSVLCLSIARYSWATIKNLELFAATAGEDGVAAFILRGNYLLLFKTASSAAS